MRTPMLAAAGIAAFAAATVMNQGSSLRAQAPAPAGGSPTFEVASVKQNKSGDGFIRFGMMPGGRFNAINVPARELIRFAYNVQNFQIEGGPSWLNSERFDIVAKAEGDVGPVAPGTTGPVQLMMRALLADRFKLVVRTETKEMPVYAMVIARTDGKTGNNLRPATVDCAAMIAARRGAPPPGPPPGPPQPGQRPPCGMFMGPGSIAAGSVTMAQLAQSLSPRVNRVIIDRTGLTGQYEFNLDFTPDQMPNFPGGGTPPSGAPPLPPIDPTGPSLFTAIQEQLGLKLDSQRGPVEVLVISSVEHPTED